jgi:glycosyltransferase involved in cell wall biosynthesis
MQLTVVIPTHNPRLDYLRRVLEALRTQTLPLAQWELLIVDNRSEPPVAEHVDPSWHPGGRIVTEENLGLTNARVRGFRETTGEIVVLVDDDNVLAPSYLADVIRVFFTNPQIGAIGGPSRPEFEMSPPAWTREFSPLLALRDLGAQVIVAGLERATNGPHFAYPSCAPIGAGMAVRRIAVLPWMKMAADPALSDRRGSTLSSGGDNDIVLAILRAGWKVGYFPELSLTHLIPGARLDPEYLARLNRGIQKSWMQVLTRHGANPWRTIPAWTAPLRELKAWFTYRGWSRPAGRIRWQGACGHFDGRVSA